MSVPVAVNGVAVAKTMLYLAASDRSLWLSKSLLLIDLGLFASINISLS